MEAVLLVHWGEGNDVIHITLTKEPSMSDIEPRPIPGAIAPSPPSALSSGDLIRRVAADLTPFQAVRVGKKISKHRMRAAVELARLEDETVLAESRVIAQAKVEDLKEQAELLLHKKRMECVTEAALAHEEASRTIDMFVKDEATHAMFKDALRGVSARYANGVGRRSNC
jgi:hypothetical protein